MGCWVYVGGWVGGLCGLSRRSAHHLSVALKAAFSGWAPPVECQSSIGLSE
jgi:hypothetical protein